MVLQYELSEITFSTESWYLNAFRGFHQVGKKSLIWKLSNYSLFNIQSAKEGNLHEAVQWVTLPLLDTKWTSRKQDSKEKRNEKTETKGLQPVEIIERKIRQLELDKKIFK